MVVISMILVAACRKEPVAPTYTSIQPPPPKTAPVRLKTQTGIASYYAKYFDGRTAANGERFSNKELVAAHPTFPFGTKVQVTNLENNKSAQVEIIDRGPTKENVKEGVIIDLSQAAARELNMMDDGRVKVRVDVLSWGEGV